MAAMTAPTLREWLREQPFRLTMSSGFFSFFAHTGVMSVLEDEGLLPARASGSSAGALVTGAWAAGLSAYDLGATLRGLRREDFWDPRPGLGVLAGGKFRALLHDLLPEREMTKLRVPVAISVFDVRTRRTAVLTAGDLAAAIHASCAVPVMFHPVRIDGRSYLDGGILDRPGLDGVAPGERVLFHHIVSRSPWRRAGSSGMAIPRRDGLVTLAIHDLPRASPFHLANGRRAMDAARAAAKRALDRPAREVVNVGAG